MNSSATKFYVLGQIMNSMFFCLVIILLISTCEPMGIFQRRCSEKSQIWKEKHCHFENSDESKCSIALNIYHDIEASRTLQRSK
ncbi:hypothetical protein P8452_73603 [Trifolium repens]|nr:hypothetical protein P8452_73603 [Trifolium repens]